ncbi:hypothetical protein ABEB36_012661 [Hypothenemus hampei]|uniref:BPTI/Kunitz inhibitor domain-containing protein n=1 Tax=Hypothenemus hampei TaxID=57062 RepID=A0ABD1ECM3_HYPHA
MTRSIFALVIIVFLVTNSIVGAKVLQEVPEITRKIHGSYGSFRDFTARDCNQPHENNGMRCSNQESPAFAYHWNNELKGCERVIYKGCGSTRNNFVTERDCNSQAKPICNK